MASSLSLPLADRPAVTGGDAIALDGVRVRYPGQAAPVLAIDHLAIERGERVAVVGPSGSGKTTLLRLVNGAVSAESGTVRVLGRTLGPARRQGRTERCRVAMIFQDFALVQRASVFDNVLFGRLGHAHPWLSLIGHFDAGDRAIAEQAAREVGLTDHLWQRADRLSGGQRQRVAIARALAQEAELILADEPVSNLDPGLTDDVLELLTGAVERRGATLIMSLHQPQLARAHARRVIGLSQGRLVFDGPSAELSGEQLRQIYGRPALRPTEHVSTPETADQWGPAVVPAALGGSGAI
jgi:phosphonate transport system ATP-binding protein